MSVRPWRAEIRFHKTGKMGPGNSGAGNLGSRQFSLIFAQYFDTKYEPAHHQIPRVLFFLV